ncbi:helix-turn-helix domain-containing protein [Providencia sp. PROV258]|uniref:helix-turn-helix domain-containing protein n=1 Tax=Providencia sp. PROV258 TaxID=2949946 RepID=UPI00234991F5|nr:helix-turn-helix transcriptional regulator [Providencia sp. PROV258]
MISTQKNFIVKNINLEIGDFIRKTRLKNGLTGTQLGKLVGVSQQQISRYERGSNGLSLPDLIFILSIMNASFSDFVSYSSYLK